MDDAHAGYGAVKPINRLVSNDLKADAGISLYALFNDRLEPFNFLLVRSAAVIENPTYVALKRDGLRFDESGIVAGVLGF